jgi:hypothetical protein
MGRVKLNIPPPNPKQQQFFLARARYIAYGGARAGGKSWAMRVKFVLLCLRYAGIQILLLRRTLPELTENHVNPLLRLLKGIATYNKQEKVFTFPNGSRLKLGYCSNEQDVLQYQGQAYDVIGMEEATMFTEFQYNCLRESNRSSGLMKEKFSPRMYLTMNPGGVGHHWVKRLFVDRAYKGKERPEDYVFIPAKVYDNTAFMEADPDYVAQLESLPEKRRKMMLLGDWSSVEGAFFEEFANNPEHYKDRQWTHVIDPFEIPSHWKIYRSFDFGYHRPFSTGYWTVDEDGVIYRILEWYGCTATDNEGLRIPPNQIFEEMAKLEREHPWLKGRKITGVADPSIWDASRGESVAESASKHKIYFTPGDNERIAGWMQVHYRLAFDENGYPMMYIFSNCKAFIRTVPALQYDDHKVEDLDTDGEDHVADEVRYFCMSRPIKPRVSNKPDDYTGKNPLNLFLDIPKESLGKATARPRMMIIKDGGKDGSI